MSLQFPVAELQRELHALDAMASAFLARGSQGRLSEAAEQLARIHKSHRDDRWEIAEDAPLETKVSEGNYQPGDLGAHHFWATISFVWEVRPIDKKMIQIRDLASTRVSLCGERVLGVFNMDIGASNAPGCYFHTQIQNGGEAGSELQPFPHDLDVPRFPTFVPTPASVVEFVISELFQGAWAQHVARAKTASLWASAQKRWWRRHLDWQKGVVDEAGFSPWVELKGATPGWNSFC